MGTHEEDDGRVPDQCDGRGEFTFVAAGVIASAFVCVLHQPESPDSPLRNLPARGVVNWAVIAQLASPVHTASGVISLWKQTVSVSYNVRF